MTTHPDTPGKLAAVIQTTTFTTGTISSPRKSPSAALSPQVFQTGARPELLAAHSKKIRLRRLSANTELPLQAEFFINEKTFHRSISETETTTLLEACYSGIFARGEFSGPDGKHSVLVNKKGDLTLVSTKDPVESVSGDSLLSHDRIKQRILPEGTPVPFLIDLGVMTTEGAIIKSKYPKYRQINRFLEFVTDVLPQLRDLAREKAGTPLHIVDFGCGKSYLTFALYYYLTHTENLPIRITGLDLKKDVIDTCNLLAQNYGYSDLSFEVGDIARYTNPGKIDMVVSLHACDTATDFALARAVQWKASVIFAVPCCQHELNKQLESGATKIVELKPLAQLAPLLRHGLVRERFAALLTDTLRAELLESCGYQVQIVEFIDMSHTPKNILIRAVRKNNAAIKPSESYRDLAAFFGVSPTLEKELFCNDADSRSATEE